MTSPWDFVSEAASEDMETKTYDVDCFRLFANPATLAWLIVV